MSVNMDDRKYPLPSKKDRASKRRDPSTSEHPYSDDEVEFLKAVDRRKRETNSHFLMCHEYRDVLISLGYRKGASP